MYDLRNDAVSADFVIKVKMIQRRSLLDGYAGAVIVAAFPTDSVVPAPPATTTPSLSILRTDRSHWETICFPGTAIRFHPCSRFSREQVVRHLLLVLQ
jgi:hypothetical protein